MAEGLEYWPRGWRGHWPRAGGVGQGVGGGMAEGLEYWPRGWRGHWPRGWRWH